jgi:cell cycle checkpoint protein
MKGRPAKRQKRHVLRSSDSDNGDHHGSDSSSSYTESRVKRTVSSSPATKKQQPARNTRAKAKSKPETKKDGGMKQADLSSFYKKATYPPGTPPTAPKPAKEEPDYVAELEDDLIQDDDLDALMLEAEHRSQQSRPPTSVESSQASRTKSAAQPPKQNLPVRRLHVFGDAGGVASTKGPATAKDLPWVQRWPPRTLEELGVHKKKVQDVRTWLERALNGDPHKVGI